MEFPPCSVIYYVTTLKFRSVDNLLFYIRQAALYMTVCRFIFDNQFT